MSVSKDQSYAGNITNFATLVSRVAGMGNSYAPANPAYQLAGLKALLNAAQANWNDMNTNDVVVKKAIDDRVTGFKGVRKYGTMIVNCYKSLINDRESIDTLIGLNKKLQGTRIGKGGETPNVGAEGADNSISASQQTYTNIVEHLDRMAKLVALQADYKPNEAGLKITGIQAAVVDLQALNQDYIDKNTDLMNARKERNNLHFEPTIGIHSVAKGVKQCVAATFGTASPEYKQIRSLSFLAPRITRKRKRPTNDQLNNYKPTDSDNTNI